MSDDVSPYDPPIINVVSKGPDFVVLSYATDITSSSTILYNLIMNGVTMYSGVQSSFQMNGLDAASCYRYYIMLMFYCKF